MISLKANGKEVDNMFGGCNSNILFLFLILMLCGGGGSGSNNCCYDNCGCCGS